MCGITGILNLGNEDPVSENTLRQMLGMIRHRGPDGFGIYLDDHVGLGSARLSIIDLSSGDQPISNEDGSLWIVFNGEIFNYIELRPPLERRGHQIATQSDTEVILHLYEDYGPDCLKLLNGQFAIAIWDANQRSLFLARDRLGIRPLYYTLHNGKLIFGSEIKCLFAGGVPPAIDPLALEQIFTYWSMLSPRSAFQDICDVPPGHYLQVAWFAFEAPSGVLAGISRLNAEILGRTAVRSTLEPQPLGSLNAGQTVIVDLTVLAPETVRGILALRFGATNPHGKSITEGDGVPIGLLGREPVRRLEAVEFPAGTAQEAARRPAAAWPCASASLCSLSAYWPRRLSRTGWPPAP